MRTHSLALIFTASLLGPALGGCANQGVRQASGYHLVELATATDPLAPPMSFPTWTPPRQMAAWVHPHRDVNGDALVGGHWVLLLLDRGHWYTEAVVEQDPVPDAEATPEELHATRASLVADSDAVIPYRNRKDR